MSWWFKEDTPKTGSGKATPKGTRSFWGVVFRKADGTVVPEATTRGKKKKK